jgi:Caenorhabditis protein of unknown function, DUF268
MIIRKLRSEFYLLKQTTRGIARVLQDKTTFRQSALKSDHKTAFPFGKNSFQFNDVNDEGGVASGHYFHQDLLVARKIFENHPIRHIDVGSRIDGFVAHVATFRTIEVLDTRAISSQVPGISFAQADLMNLPAKYVNCTDSLSCLHTLEHIGLGRYGDKIDFDGWLLALQNLWKMLKSNGILYLSVPTGKIQRVEFNAHRVFSVEYLAPILMGMFKVIDISFVDDSGYLHQNVSLSSDSLLRSFDSSYGLSIWVLEKR